MSKHTVWSRESMAKPWEYRGEFEESDGAIRFARRLFHEEQDNLVVVKVLKKQDNSPVLTITHSRDPLYPNLIQSAVPVVVECVDRPAPRKRNR